MRSATRLMLCVALLAALTFGVLAQPAHAGPIEEGALFGVFPDGPDGTFEGAENYTVVRFMEFGGFYPDSLQPVSWPSTGSGFDPGNPESGTPVQPGSQFFLIGNIAGVDPLDSHLLLSVQGADRGTPAELFTPFNEGSMQTLHDNLIAGTAQFSLNVPDPASSISVDDFWANYEEGVQQQFFGLDLLQGGPFDGQQGAVVQLSAGSYEFDGGSEDLFGYTPNGGFDDYSCLCDKAWYFDQFFLKYGIETSFYDLASKFFDCGPGNPFITATLKTGITTLTEIETRNGDVIVNPVPEPASLVLLGSSLLVGYGARRRRRRAA